MQTQSVSSGQASAPMERLIPRAKVAFFLGVTTRTIKRWEAKKLLTPHHLNSRLISYPEAQVQTLISSARPTV